MLARALIAEEGNVNWLAIIIAAVANMVIGFLWYGPVFGKSWMTLSGRGMGQGTSAGPLYALTALAAFVEAVAVNWFINETGWTTGAITPTSSSKTFPVAATGFQIYITYADQAKHNGDYNLNIGFDASGFGPDMPTPCVSCTSILDGLNGAAPHIRQRVNFAVAAKSPLARIREVARG